MNQQQLDYLEAMEKGFRETANEARKKLRTICFVDEYIRMEFCVDSMDTCSKLVKQIRSDLLKFEKGSEEAL